MLVHSELEQFRPNVGIILLNPDGFVWLGRRVPAKAADPDQPYAWQLPQGGMDPGEAPTETAFRELYEETGVKSAKLLTITPGWMAYEFPPNYGSKKGEKWRGQKQKWAVMLFTGNDAEIDLDAHDEREFVEWRWAPFDEMADSIIPFKLGVYKELLDSFRPLAAFIGASRNDAWGWPDDLT